jgi:hypothetical protein
MHMRSYNFLASTLPPPAIVVLVEALDVQFNWYKPNGCHALWICWVLHWKCWICHVAIAAVDVVELLEDFISLCLVRVEKLPLRLHCNSWASLLRIRLMCRRTVQDSCLETSGTVGFRRSCRIALRSYWDFLVVARQRTQGRVWCERILIELGLKLLWRLLSSSRWLVQDFLQGCNS